MSFERSGGAKSGLWRGWGNIATPNLAASTALQAHRGTLHCLFPIPGNGWLYTCYAIWQAYQYLRVLPVGMDSLWIKARHSIRINQHGFDFFILSSELLSDVCHSELRRFLSRSYFTTCVSSPIMMLSKKYSSSWMQSKISCEISSHNSFCSSCKIFGTSFEHVFLILCYNGEDECEWKAGVLLIRAMVK